MTSAQIPVRPWRSVPAATPAGSQLQLLAAPDRLLLQSPLCRPPQWLLYTFIVAAEVLFMFGVFFLPSDDSSDAPFRGPLWAGTCGFWALVVFLALIGWILLIRTQRWFKLEVTRDSWTVRRVRPECGGAMWRRTGSSGATAALTGAQVVTSVAGDSGYECALVLPSKDSSRTVYANTPHNPLFSLSLSELEFAAAEINRFLEDNGHAVAAALDGPADPEASPSKGKQGLLAASKDGDGAYAGGAPFARAARYVPAIPPAGLGFERADDGDAVTITLPQPLANFFRATAVANAVLAAVFAALSLGCALSMPDTGTWVVWAAVSLGLGVCTRQGFNRWRQAHGKLTLAPHGWRIVQLPVFRKDFRWANLWQALSTREGAWRRVAGAKVISTQSTTNGFTVPVATMHGTVALVDTRGALDTLPIDVACALPPCALEYIAAAINAYLSGGAVPENGRVSGIAPPENETHLSPLADLCAAPACVVHSTRAQAPGAAMPSGKEQKARARALSQQQSEELAALSGRGSDALSRLQALNPVATRRVAPKEPPAEGALSLRIAPDRALRPAHGALLAVALTLVCEAAICVWFLKMDTVLAGASEAVWAIANVGFFIGLFAAFVGSFSLVSAPWVAELHISAEQWSMRQCMRWPWCSARLFAYTRTGRTCDLIGCEVISNAKVPAHIKLLLRTSTRAYTVSQTPWLGLSLREKVAVMRYVNLHLASYADGGESGSGTSVRSPLLTRA